MHHYRRWESLNDRRLTSACSCVPVAGTLPNDFSLRGNMTQEYKGEDKTEARVLPAEVDGNNPLSTAGPPGDKAHRKDFQVCLHQSYVALVFVAGQG